MARISLVIPLACRNPLVDLDIESYRRALEEQVGVGSVEVILSGEAGEPWRSSKADSLIVLPMNGKNQLECLHEAMRVATGDIVVVLDPSRRLCAGSFGTGGAGAQACQGRSGDWRSGTVSQLALLQSGHRHAWAGGARFAGHLLRVDGDQAGPTVGLWSRIVPQRGSRLALDLLAGPFETRIDVPVTTRSGDRILPGAIRIDDLRQLKRVLDHRFGTFSRLVQFCMVGASGMVVDLTLYALFQLLFARFWPLPSGPSVSGFSWSLATARALSILVALVWNFALNRRLTFNDARRGSILRQFVNLCAGQCAWHRRQPVLRLYLPLHVGFFARHRLAAAVVGIVVATGISFSMSRWVVFIRRPESRVAPQQAHQAHLAVDSALR